ncbi:MAG: HNH endonuclease [Cyclobacteriaceae bacterium]
MTESDLIDKFLSVRAWQSGDKRAPHKSLLMLYALAQLQNNKEMFSYEEVEEKLMELLVNFGPPSKPRPQYPFVRLANDNIWSFDQPELISSYKGVDPGRPFLIRHKIKGGFTSEIISFLKKHPDLINKLALEIVANSFPETIQEDILDAVGLNQNILPTASRRKRDPAFREKIMIAYEYQCAVCGFNVRLGHQPLALEAAHIKWHQAGGPDEAQNGLALCSLHHKLFDLGAYTINDRFQLIVSDKVNGSRGKQEWLLDFHAKEIRRPQSKFYEPKDTYLEWHVNEVFKGYGRN